jgi:hypothetical protein
MPNYVNSSVRFHSINAAAVEKLNLLKQRLGEHANFCELMYDGTFDKEEMYTRAWQHEHIGPKWTHIEDIDDDGMLLTSAWSDPTMGVEWLIGELAKVDPDLVTIYTYEEEQPAFFGVYVYKGTEVYDGYEDEWDDIIFEMKNEFPEFAEAQDEDGDITDEGWEIFHENIWEFLNDNADRFITETLETLENGDSDG